VPVIEVADFWWIRLCARSLPAIELDDVWWSRLCAHEPLLRRPEEEIGGPPILPGGPVLAVGLP
jgi:hypothetical protein